MKRVVILGSTGSIGTSSLEVVSALSDQVQVLGLTAHRSTQLLAEQCQRYQPRWAVLSDESLREGRDLGQFPSDTELLFGQAGIETVAGSDDVDIVISGIVGAAGLMGTWAAVNAGKTVGIANKETLVVGGSLIIDAAQQSEATLIPVDSEHSAIFQALQAGRPNEVKRIVLTASGGPFRGWKAKDLESVTPEQALAHPTWNMGPKITIDSATLMNKALEVIEAKWLFGIEANKIEVVVHPQSIIHSFVEFVDGSVIAQLSPPDMKLPIQYALTYPARVPGISPQIDWKEAMTLDFSPPDLDAFPALELGYEVARQGGSCGAVLNAANEIAVQRFLTNNLRFQDIARMCRAVLDVHHYSPNPSLTELFELDCWARQEADRWQP